MRRSVKLLLLTAGFATIWKSCARPARDAAGFYVLRYPDGTAEILIIEPDESTYTRYQRSDGIDSDTTIGPVVPGRRSIAFGWWQNFRDETPVGATAVTRQAGRAGHGIEFRSDPDGGPQWIFKRETRLR